MHFIYCLDVDECKVRNPCKNGAKCVNSVGGYSCRCPANYKGNHCDEGIVKMNCPLSVLFCLSMDENAVHNQESHTKAKQTSKIKEKQFMFSCFYRC